MDSILKIIYDVKIWIAGYITAFLGPTFDSLILISVLCVADLLIGYYKNKKLKNEKFSMSRVLEKLSQAGKFIIVLAASIVSDHFFIRNGFDRYAVAMKICDIYAIWLFLHMVENISQTGDINWLKLVKKYLSQKIDSSIEITEEKKGENDEQTK